MLFEQTAIGAPPSWRPTRQQNANDPTSWERILYYTGQPLVNLAAQLSLDLDILRDAPLPAGPKIIAANHPSTTDPLVMTTLASEPVHILITEVVFRIPAIGPLLRRAGQIPVLLDNGRKAFDEALQRLNDGQTVGIFPEGSLSPAEGGLHNARTGAVRLALAAGVPIVPVGIHLQRERLCLIDARKHLDEEIIRWYFHGPYAMTVGKPITLTGSVEDRPHVRAASASLLDRIGALAKRSERRMERKKEAQSAKTEAWRQFEQTLS